MTYPEFHISIFQIADMWCDGVSADEYVALLELILDAVSCPSGGGRREFRDIEGETPRGLNVSPFRGALLN